MSLQFIFHKELFELLPRISSLINTADKFNANQIVCATVRAAMNSVTSVLNMTANQQEEFQSNLIDTFKAKNWVGDKK